MTVGVCGREAVASSGERPIAGHGECPANVVRPWAGDEVSCGSIRTSGSAREPERRRLPSSRRRRFRASGRRPGCSPRGCAGRRGSSAGTRAGRGRPRSRCRRRSRSRSPGFAAPAIPARRSPSTIRPASLYRITAGRIGLVDIPAHRRSEPPVHADAPGRGCEAAPKIDWHHATSVGLPVQRQPDRRHAASRRGAELGHLGPGHRQRPERAAPAVRQRAHDPHDPLA